MFLFTENLFFNFICKIQSSFWEQYIWTNISATLAAESNKILDKPEPLLIDSVPYNKKHAARLLLHITNNSSCCMSHYTTKCCNRICKKLPFAEALDCQTEIGCDSIQQKYFYIFNCFKFMKTCYYRIIHLVHTQNTQLSHKNKLRSEIFNNKKSL